MLAAALITSAASLPTTPPAGAAERQASSPATASVALAPVNAEVFQKLGGAVLDDPATGRVPNYLRALAVTHPGAVQPLAHLFRTVLYGGTVAPETKAAMGLVIAKENGSGYLAAHMTRV